MSANQERAESIIAHEDGCLISLTVSPRAGANRIEIDPQGSIRVRLTAPPVDGAANASLLKFLASILDTPRSTLTIMSGAVARHKRVLVRGMDPEETRRALYLAANRENT